MQMKPLTLALIVLAALLVWDILDRLFVGSMLDGFLPANYEVSV